MNQMIARSVHFRKWHVHPELLNSCNMDLLPCISVQGMDYKQLIGKRIRDARKDKGWGMRELSEATDNVVSISRINNYEHGARKPGQVEAVLLAKALGKRPAYFLGVDDVQTTITTVEEALVRNWRALPENERMKLFREIEVTAMRYRDPVQDAQVEKHLPSKVPARRKVKR